MAGHFEENNGKHHKMHCSTICGILALLAMITCQFWHFTNQGGSCVLLGASTWKRKQFLSCSPLSHFSSSLATPLFHAWSFAFVGHSSSWLLHRLRGIAFNGRTSAALDALPTGAFRECCYDLAPPWSSPWVAGPPESSSSFHRFCIYDQLLIFGLTVCHQCSPCLRNLGCKFVIKWQPQTTRRTPECKAQLIGHLPNQFNFTNFQRTKDLRNLDLFAGERAIQKAHSSSPSVVNCRFNKCISGCGYRS